MEAIVDPDDVLLTPFTELELLQGCRDEEEWSLLAAYLETQEYLAPSRKTWAAAARIFFDLRRLGKTVRSPIDCCIAQIAIEQWHAASPSRPGFRGDRRDQAAAAAVRTMG